jgi:hypothetical protein
MKEAHVHEPARKLSDKEFEEAIFSLQCGHVPFESAEMLQRFAETIVAKLWETHEEPVEAG